MVLPANLMAHIGHTIERIKLGSPRMDFHIEDVDGSEYANDCRNVFGDKPNEDAVLSIKEEANRHCSVLFELIGAVDRARKRHVWLLKLGKPLKDMSKNSQRETTLASKPALDHQGSKETHEAERAVLEQKPVSAYMDEILRTDS